MTGKVVDFKKIQTPIFKKKKGRPPVWVRHLNGLEVVIRWVDHNDEFIEVVFDPNNPFMTMTRDGKVITIEMLQEAIIWICEGQPDLAAEYTQFLERAHEYLKKFT